jgi:AraC-like DNA-binding protein
MLAVFLSLWAVSVSVLLIVVVRLFRKKSVAYGAIVRKIDEEMQMRNDKRETVDAELQTLFCKMEQLLDHTDIYCDPNITIDDVAERLYVSTRQLSQAINVVTGSTFTALVSKRRINKALSIIKNSDNNLNMDGLAASVGFAGRTGFSRAFKREIGISPTDYLRSRTN